MTDHLQRIIERVNRNGDFEDEGSPVPLLTLEEFFEGNDVVGSIGCNLEGEPRPSVIKEVLLKIREQPKVHQIYVQITAMDDPDWPFSDKVWIITTAEESAIWEWFPEELAPEDIWEGWDEDEVYEKVDVPQNYRVLACWWD